MIKFILDYFRTSLNWIVYGKYVEFAPDTAEYDEEDDSVVASAFIQSGYSQI